MTAARRTPLIAAVPKMFFPFLVILPGPDRASSAVADGRPSIVASSKRAADRGHPDKIDGTGRSMLDGDGRRARLRPGDPDAAAALLPDRHAGPRPDGAAGELHVGHGGQRHRVQHRVDLRHLPGLHPAEGRATRTICGWGGWRPSSASPRRSRRRTSPRSSTTSWTCCSWCSRSSTRRCSRRSCSACSGSARPATARSPACVAGTAAAALHHGLTLPAGAIAGVKGGWLARRCTRYPSEMAQNFWTAICA